MKIGTFELKTVGLSVGVLLVHMSVGLLDRTTVVGLWVRRLVVAVARGMTLEQMRVLCIWWVTSRVHRVLKLIIRMGCLVIV